MSFQCTCCITNYNYPSGHFQNIRIMAKYYTRITMERMAGLLDLSVDVSYVIKYAIQ